MSRVRVLLLIVGTVMMLPVMLHDFSAGRTEIAVDGVALAGAWVLLTAATKMYEEGIVAVVIAPVISIAIAILVVGWRLLG
jgi:hypothetical protein